MNRKPEKTRKQLLVDTNVQGALMLRIAGQWLCFLVALLVALPAWELALSNNPFATSATEAFKNGLKHSAPVFVLLLALIPAFVWDTLKLSHRFTGPMRRLRSAIRAAADGEHIEPLKFRKGDFWGEVPADFNRMLARFRREQNAPAESESEFALHS